jgi:hypothetical protein
MLYFMYLSNMCRRITVLVEIGQNTDTLRTKYLRVYEGKRFAQELRTKCEHVSVPNKRFL